MRLIQFEDTNGQRQVGLVDGALVRVLRDTRSTRELALAAIRAHHGLAQEVALRGTDAGPEYATLLHEGRVLPPLDHEDPAHCLISGTGLTHLGSAAARDKMHQHDGEVEAGMTDTMRMFKWGLENGKPPAGEAGAQPEWFYKGDGSIVVRPGGDFPVPPFAEDAGEEPELAGLYVIGDDGRPYRLGYALGNEFSDHVMERRNYLYLAHSKLRFCAYGPELRVGELPRHLAGYSRIKRDGQTIWEQEFLSGEDNMCHSLANLEFHHFKYAQFLRPGDVHVHFFGTATLSFADQIQTREGDRFEISMAEFGEPLVNGIQAGAAELPAGKVKPL